MLAVPRTREESLAGEHGAIYPLLCFIMKPEEREGDVFRMVSAFPQHQRVAWRLFVALCASLMERASAPYQKATKGVVGLSRIRTNNP